MDLPCFSQIIATVLVLILVSGFVVLNLVLLLSKRARHLWQLLKMLYDLQLSLAKIKKLKSYSFIDVFEKNNDKDPSMVQFISADTNQSYTIGEIEYQANCVANWALTLGLREKSTIAMSMLNRPEFVSLWIGFAKIGHSSALLNTNISGSTLSHSINVALSAGLPEDCDTKSVKIWIVDDELHEKLSNDIALIASEGVQVFYWSDVVKTFKDFKGTRPSSSHRSSVIYNDPLLWIFTSGTTGLPKASKITHSRYLSGSMPYFYLCQLSPDNGDRVYCPLPLYHSAGGMLGVGTCLRNGITMVLRKKFSASKFAEDCYTFKCTSMQYIGELCRYLLKAPVSEYDEKLNLKTAFGNGIRPDVWSSFQDRFRIGKVVEFYASTEGNVALFNSTGKIGPLGYIPRWVDVLYPVKLIRVEAEAQDVPLRDTDGKCIICKPGEIGLAINIIDESRADRRFEGYSDKEATKKKILTDVFKANDRYFNTGDLMYRDEQGYYYWSDRVGDTFRWKGENVSTAEVASVLTKAVGINDANVYGVSIPGCDGRAGMVAITLDEGVDVSSFDLKSLIEVYSRDLPTYSRPIFLRFLQKSNLTSTFKHVKGDLIKEGFNPTKVTDEMFMYQLKESKFVKLSHDLFEKVVAGKVTF